MRVKFLRDYKVKAAGGEHYTAGQEVDLSEASARHFINRGAAEEVKPAAKFLNAEKPAEVPGAKANKSEGKAAEDKAGK